MIQGFYSAATALNTAYDPIPRVITPATVYRDEPKTFTYDNQDYSPGNFGDKYSMQPVTLRDAIVHSLNVVTVDVAMDVTIGRVMKLAEKAGLPKVQRAYPAMAVEIQNALVDVRAGAGKKDESVRLSRGIKNAEVVGIVTEVGSRKT